MTLESYYLWFLPISMKLIVITAGMLTTSSQFTRVLPCSTVLSFQQPCEIGILSHWKFDSLKVYPHSKSIYLRTLYFNTGFRVGQILHTRLRLECSALNNDLYRRNLICSPLCECDEIETATHYILQCQRFNECRRQRLSDLLLNSTLRDLLFGALYLNDQENEEAFHKVQHFILERKRFQRT